MVLAAFACSCTNIQAPNTQFKKYEVTQVSLTKANLAFLFDVENPNSIPIGIKDINYSVALDGNSIVSGTHEGFSMQAKEKISIMVPVEVNYSQLIGKTFALAKKFLMKDSIAYKLEGQVSIVDNVGFSARVPFEANGEIKFF